MKKGSIICNVCKKPMKKPVCERCGNTNCYISVYWKGKHYTFRRDSRGEVYDYREAFKALAKINASMEDQKHKFDPSEWTDSSIKQRKFETQLEIYYLEKEREVKVGELSPEYFRIIKNYGKNYFDYFCTWDIREVDRAVINSFKRERLDENLKIKTRKNILNALRAFFSWLYENGEISQTPAFPKIKGDDSTPRRAMRRNAQEDALSRIPEQFRDPIEFCMKTGIRPGEFCAILVKSVDIANKMVWIERTLSGTTYRETTKNKTKLPAYLNDSTLEIVKRNVKGKFPNDFLFINPVTGKGYRPKYLSGVWKRYSGVDFLYYEGTRHSFCTQAVPLSNPMDAQRLMRHKDRRSTDNYYHAYNDHLLEIVRRMDNVHDLSEAKEGNE